MHRKYILLIERNFYDLNGHDSVGERELVSYLWFSKCTKTGPAAFYLP